MRGRRARGLAAAFAVAALAAAGTGCGEEPTTKGPSSATFTVPGEATPAAPPPECPRGGVSLTSAQASVRVADLRGTRPPIPATLRTSNDLTLECLRWSAWGGERAEGRGVARLLQCTPTCATGQLRFLPVDVVLTGRRRCDGTAFYTDARLRLREAADLPQPPKAYVTPPC